MFPTRLTIVKNVLRWYPALHAISDAVRHLDPVVLYRLADQKPDKEFILTLVRKYLRVLERYLGFPRYCSTPKVVPRRNLGVSRPASYCLDIPFLSRPSPALRGAGARA